MQYNVINDLRFRLLDDSNQFLLVTRSRKTMKKKTNTRSGVVKGLISKKAQLKNFYPQKKQKRRIFIAAAIMLYNCFFLVNFSVGRFYAITDRLR
jgi:hypothetical protein